MNNSDFPSCICICPTIYNSILNSRFITNIIVNINSDTTQSLFSGICLTQCNSQSKSIFQESDSVRFLFANQETITSHRNQSGVLFQLTFILSSMIQVKLMNVIIRLTSLSTIVIRLIAIQVLRGYLQAHLDLQTMYIVQRNLSRCVVVL